MIEDPLGFEDDLFRSQAQVRQVSLRGDDLGVTKDLLECDYVAAAPDEAQRRLCQSV